MATKVTVLAYEKKQSPPTALCTAQTGNSAISPKQANRLNKKLDNMLWQ